VLRTAAGEGHPRYGGSWSSRSLWARGDLPSCGAAGLAGSRRCNGEARTSRGW
jgi:hypothetical protein